MTVSFLSFHCRVQVQVVSLGIHATQRAVIRLRRGIPERSRSFDLLPPCSESMYADLPPPKSSQAVKKEEPPVEEKQTSVPNGQSQDEAGNASQTPEFAHGIELPEWSREPRCQLVLEEIKDDVVLSRIPMHERKAYVIGRENDVVDLQLLHPTISRKHVLIVHGVSPETPAAYQSTGVTIVDLGSSAGTFMRRGVHGRRRKLTPGATVVLKDEMVFQFGSSTRMYRILGTKEDPLRSSVQGKLADISKIAEAIDEGDVNIAYPKELHPAVRKRLEAGSDKPGVSNPFRLSNMKADDSDDIAPRALTVNEHFRQQSVLGKRSSETAFSNQTSKDTLWKEQMRQRSRLAQRTQEQTTKGSDDVVSSSLLVEPGVGPGSRVSSAAQERGDRLREKIVSQHLTRLKESEDCFLPVSVKSEPGVNVKEEK